MKVLAICRLDANTDPKAMSLQIAAEAEALQECRARGALVEAYSPGGPGAVLMLEAQGVSDAEALVATLPLHQAGLIQSEVTGLYPLVY